MDHMGQIGHSGDKGDDRPVPRRQGLRIGAALGVIAPPQRRSHRGQAGQCLGGEGAVHADGIGAKGGDGGED